MNWYCCWLAGSGGGCMEAQPQAARPTSIASIVAARFVADPSAA
jgi:hypothetical protein